jgi:DNA-binding protein HU-beta
LSDLNSAAEEIDQLTAEERRALGIDRPWSRPIESEVGKAELVARLASNMKLTKKTTRQFVEEFGRVVRAIVERTGRLNLPGFGTFTRRTRKARRILNPINGEWIQLPEAVSVGFRVSKKGRKK